MSIIYPPFSRHTKLPPSVHGRQCCSTQTSMSSTYPEDFVGNAVAMRYSSQSVPLERPLANPLAMLPCPFPLDHHSPGYDR